MRSDGDIKRDLENDKLEAEAAAKRVAGVLGVASDIEVRLPSLDQRPDPEIAREAPSVFKSQQRRKSNG